MAHITNKTVKIHFECSCGRNVVDSDSFLIRWKDFSTAGIKRKVDKITGKSFLFQHQVSTECHCNEE